MGLFLGWDQYLPNVSAGVLAAARSQETVRQITLAKKTQLVFCNKSGFCTDYVDSWALRAAGTQIVLTWDGASVAVE